MTENEKIFRRNMTTKKAIKRLALAMRFSGVNVYIPGTDSD